MCIEIDLLQLQKLQNCGFWQSQKQNMEQRQWNFLAIKRVLGSIVVSIPACHAGDRGSIPRRGEHIFDSGFEEHVDVFKSYIDRVDPPTLYSF